MLWSIFSLPLRGDNKNEIFRSLYITRNVHHKSSDLWKKKLCLNEVRQSVITHEITDSKVLSHKKAHKDAQEGKEKENPKELWILCIIVKFPFSSWHWQISNGKKSRRKSCKKIRVVNTQNYDKFSLQKKERKFILSIPYSKMKGKSDTMSGIIRRGKSESF